MRPSGELILTLWTDDAAAAAAADAAGVDRIGLDLEVLGKQERQAGRGMWISGHSLERLPEIRASLRSSALFARANSLHPESSAEVERLIGHGCQVIMLPNFKRASEVASFLELVGGRAKVAPLVERISAVEELDEILALPGIDEIHVGLNDLAIDLGLPHRMSALLRPVVETIAARAGESGTLLGLGGIAKAGDLDLPVSADLVYARLASLGVGAALLARSFGERGKQGYEMAGHVQRARERYRYWARAGRDEHAAARLALEARLAEIEGEARAIDAGRQ